MFKEFRKFAMRGNVIDLAVGLVIGASFTAIVNSLVKDIIMPPVGLVLGGVDFSNFFFVLKGSHAVQSLKAAQDTGTVTINYGQFVNTIINFIIVAFALFLVVRQLNRFVAPATPPAPAPPEDLVVLREIRDLLKARS
jgi:large conductance mechanosensitive channel